MMRELFRQEVRAARQSDWLGSIRLQPPRAGWAIFACGIGAITLVLALLAFGHYTRHEKVEGALVPRGGLVYVIPAIPGLITRVLVKEGDHVNAGQTLIEISGETSSTALGETHAAIDSQLQIKQARLRNDLEEQKHLSALQEQDLRSRLKLLRSQVERIGQRVDIQKRRADSATQLYEQWSGLSSTGVITRLQVQQQQDSALENLAQLKELEGQRFQLQEQIQQLHGELEQLPTSSSGKTSETERQLADVAESISRNAAQRAVVLRAPIAGTATNVLAHPGQAVTSQQPLLTIVPHNSELHAELWVPSRSIGFIRAGQSVVMRYQAFPYQKFGQHIGRVTSVSTSAMSPTEVSQILGRPIEEPCYLVQVELDSQRLVAYGHAEELRPGMTLSADILLERRRLIEWAVEPLYGFAQATQGGAPMKGGAH